MIRFLKSRYPKNYIINDKYEETNYKKKDSINNNIGKNSNIIQNNKKNFEIKNYKQKYIINNSKKDSEIQKNKQKKILILIWGNSETLITIQYTIL